MSRKFSFDLFRLNLEDLPDLFSPAGPGRLRSDEAIEAVLRNATDHKYDQAQETNKASYKWSVRDFLRLTTEIPGRDLLHVRLARSVLEREGSIVTDDGISTGVSSLNPPLASTLSCLFDLKRHLVAVEHSGELSQTAWKDFLEKILEDSSIGSGYFTKISLEPVAEQNEIVGIFRSFDVVTRMRVTLRIPNPELNRFTRDLYDDLRRAGIRELLQDMKSPDGLSKDENAIPHATAVLAEQGYKKGDVQFEGVRNGEQEVVKSGTSAARGTISHLRDFVRGLQANSRTKEATRALTAVVHEIDKIHPMKDPDEAA